MKKPRNMPLVWPGSGLYTYLGDGATDQREILHDGRHGSRAGLFSFGAPGQYPQGIPKIALWGNKICIVGKRNFSHDTN